MSAAAAQAAADRTIVAIDCGWIDQRLEFERHVPYRAFEDSWFALIQGIRHGPRLYDRRVFFCDHPHHPDRLSVYQHLCATPAELRDALSDLLVICRKRAAVWKTADPLAADEYLRAGFRPYGLNEGWGGGTKYDDQTYPQHVCALAPIAELRGAQFAQLRQQSTAVQRAHGELTLETFSPSTHAPACRRLAARVAADICAGQPEQMPFVASANSLFIDHPPDVSMVVSHDGQPVGFAAFDIRDSTANFDCLLYDRAFKYLATFTLVRMARILLERGATRWNLSGSEHGPLDAWKRKFAPETSIRRTHLVLDVGEDRR